jgi:hypothetical protein
MQPKGGEARPARLPEARPMRTRARVSPPLGWVAGQDGGRESERHRWRNRETD